MKDLKKIDDQLTLEIAEIRDKSLLRKYGPRERKRLPATLSVAARETVTTGGIRQSGTSAFQGNQKP
jgi:hypothetical protein